MTTKYPTFDEEDLFVDEGDNSSEGLELIGPRFNQNTASFDMNSIGQVLSGTPQETYTFWVMKCLLTERYKYLAYDSDFGVEIEEIMRSNYSREVAESEISRTIKEALDIDSRTTKVNHIEFVWEGESLSISIEVESIYNTILFNYYREGEGNARVSAA